MGSARSSAGLLLALSLIWGTTWIANAMLAQPESPLHIVMLRYLVALLLIALAYGGQRLFGRLGSHAAGPRSQGLSRLPNQTRGNVMLTGMTLGCTMFALPDLLLVWAARHGAGPWTPLIYAGLPLGLMLSSGKLRTAAILAPGAMLVLLNGSLPLTPQKIAWAAPIAAAVALQGWSLLYARDHLAEVSSLRGMLWQLLVAVVLLRTALWLWPEPGGHLSLRFWQAGSVFALFLLGLLATALAYPLYYRLLARYEPAQLAATAWLQTLVAVGESALLLHQRPGWPMIGAACALVACSVSLLGTESGLLELRLQ